MGSHECQYLAAIDMSDGNVYEFDYSLLEGYDLFMNYSHSKGDKQ